MNGVGTAIIKISASTGSKPALRLPAFTADRTMISRSALFETLFKVAYDENKYLEEYFDKGIFFVPELAFAYLCGKSIMTNESIFGKNQYEWIREKQYPSYGFADLVFQPIADGPEIVIEFKMDDSHYSYESDIAKLSSLKGNFLKFFCGLKWVYSDQTISFDNTLKSVLKADYLNSDEFDTIVAGS